MSNELLASKVIIVEEEPQVRTISAVATAVFGIVGITERGPFEATLVQSVEEYQRIFGGHSANGQVRQALEGFFTNGGTTAYVKRTVHYTDVSTPATKVSAAATGNLQSAAGSPTSGSVQGTVAAPWDLEPSDTLVIDIDGGGAATATFDAAAATLTAGNTETYALVDLQTLTVSIDGGPVQTVTFNTAEFAAIGAATAAEVAAVMNAELTGCSVDVDVDAPRITTDKRGTGSSIEVTGGTANGTLGFSTSSTPGTGDVADIDSVTFAEAKALIEADVAGCTVTQAVGGELIVTSNTTGPSSSVQVDASSTADDEFGLDNATHSGTSGAAVNVLTVDGKTDGAYANNIRPITAAPTSGEAGKFNFSVQLNGLIVEVFPNVQNTDPAAADFIETVVNDPTNGSNLVQVTDLAVGLSPALATWSLLTGGDDGLTGLADTDFIGSAAGETGLRGFDLVQDLTLVACPDRPTAAVHNALITYAEFTRDKALFAILDPPAGKTAATIITHVEVDAALLNASEFGAIYWPQVKVLNPNTTVFGNGETITVPPSGHIAGVYARTDASRPGGVYIPPAGIENGQLLGVVGFETDEVKDEAKRDLVFPKRINPLTVFPGAPRHIDGARTLCGTGNFPTVGERRGAIFIEQSIKAGLQFARHQNNTEELRETVARTVNAFLLIQMRNGAFRTKNPATAFFVDFGEGLNPPSDVFAGKLTGRIGLATNKPAEFIILRFSQDTRALQEELSAA